MNLTIQAPPLVLGPLEWGIVVLASAIILGIHGKKLLKELSGWLR